MMTMLERDAAYDALLGPVAALYRQLGACPISWVDTDMLAVLIDLDAPAVERLVQRLLSCGLVERAGDGVAFSPHGHLNARFKAEVSDAAQHELDVAGLDRLLAFLSDAAARLIAPDCPPLWERDEPRVPGAAPPFPSEEEVALEWVDGRAGVYLDAVRFAFADQRYALLCDLAHRLWLLWMRCCRPGRLIEAPILGLAATRLAYCERATGGMLTALAEAVRAVNPVAAYGYGCRAAARGEQTGDAAGLAWVLSTLGETLFGAEAIEQADGYYRDAEALHAKLGHARGLALARQGRGLVALSRGDAEAAVELLDDAHRTLADVGDRYGAALSLSHHARALAAADATPGEPVNPTRPR